MAKLANIIRFLILLAIQPSFIYLSAFSSQGGIEKFNRAFIKALLEVSHNARIYSLYDTSKSIDQRYQIDYRSFKSREKGRLIESLRILLGVKTSISIWGHINLAPLALLIRFFSRKQTQVLIAHGVEVWVDLSSLKRQFILSVDQIWAVSEYTKDKLESRYPDLKGKVRVFHNTLDPHFGESEISPSVKLGNQDQRSEIIIREKYRLDDSTAILYTLCRLSSEEGYKGYDQVLKAMALMEEEKPYYLIAGKYDEMERERIVSLAVDLGLQEKLILAGFIDDEEVIPHYRQADLFIMPSRGEGFGIVFLEAMACDCPVIAGNQDGSVDALQNGKLGELVDPKDSAAIAIAIKSALGRNLGRKKVPLKQSIQKVESIFGFEIFKQRLVEFLEDLKRS